MRTECGVSSWQQINMTIPEKKKENLGLMKFEGSHEAQCIAPAVEVPGICPAGLSRAAV